MHMRLLKYFTPLLVFILISFFLWRGLSNDPNLLPSTLIDKPIPKYHLSTVEDPNQFLTQQDLVGQMTLLNVWASWCVSCAVEHPLLMEIAKNNAIKLVGLNYRDQRQSAMQWLEQYGNPYQINLFDGDGRIAIEWGIYGTPETFLIDKTGHIRYRHVGVVDEQVWKEVLLPKIEQLKQEEVA